MPINSPKKDDYSELLTAISGLTLTGGGGNGFRYAKSADISLPANEEFIILGSGSDVFREVYLINNSNTSVQLFWNDDITVTAIPEELQPNGGIYQDWNDGGLELRAKSSVEASLKILVRDTKPIDYQVGLINNNNNNEEDEMPVDLLVNKGLYCQGQLFYVDSFRDGYQYNFIFDVNGLNIENNLTVHLFPVLFFATPRMNDIMTNKNPWQLETSWSLDQDKGNLLAHSDHQVFTPIVGNQINFSLKFYRSKFIIGFSNFQSNDYGGNDYLLRGVDYTPNIDPLLGGTFTLTEI